MSSFKELKKASSLGSLTEKLLKEAEKLNASSVSDNPNLFKLETDKAGNGSAIIRFLPAPPNEDVPFVRLYNHGFQVNGKWFIHNCPTTIGNSCFVCSRNSELWNSGIESDKNIARDRKRKLSYYANVYIVKNPADPSLEGTVKIFRFGKKIYDKILAVMKPEFEDDPTFDPFDFWSGANFRLRAKTVSGYPNYDDSSFDVPSPLLGGDDEKLEAIWKQEHPLQGIVAPDQFKSEQELEAEYNRVVGSRSGYSSSVSAQEQERDLDEMMTSSEDIIRELENSYVNSRTSSEDDLSEEADDALNFFATLAE